MVCEQCKKKVTQKKMKVTEIQWSGFYTGDRREMTEWEYREKGETFEFHGCHLHELLKIFHDYSPMIPVKSILEATEKPDNWIKVVYPKK